MSNNNSPEDFPNFLNNPVETVAERLLGCFFERNLGGRRMLARIVETEAYDEGDAASHSHRGRTARTEVMFGEAGYLYVYFTYGMHYCCNVVTGEAGHGSAVLIRAVEPVEGIDSMEERRGLHGRNLTNGPAKLCQALGIDRALDGADLVDGGHVQILDDGAPPPDRPVQGVRVGISVAREHPWRWYVDGEPNVSGRRA